MGELEAVTQNNAAMAEETAGSAEQLAANAKTLAQMTGQFDIKQPPMAGDFPTAWSMAS